MFDAPKEEAREPLGSSWGLLQSRSCVASAPVDSRAPAPLLCYSSCHQPSQNNLALCSPACWPLLAESELALPAGRAQVRTRMFVADLCRDSAAISKVGGQDMLFWRASLPRC